MNEKTLKCSTEAIQLMEYLRQIEISLGHILENKEWQSSLAAKLSQKIFSDNPGPLNNQQAELLFFQAVRKLKSEGFSEEEIANTINTYLKHPKGPVYCNAEEVSDALKAN